MNNKPGKVAAKVMAFVGIPVLILGAFFLGRLLSSKSDSVSTTTVPSHSDSAQTVQLIKENNELKDKLTAMEKLTGTKTEAHPSSGTIGKPPANFMRPDTVWIPVPDTTSKPSSGRTPILVHKQDFPIGIWFNNSGLIVNTINPYLQAIDSPYFKQYRFPRQENDFTLASVEGQTTENLDGLIVYWMKPILRWGGIDGEIGYGFYNRLHLSINAKIMILDRVELLPTLRATRDGVDAEANVKFNLWGGK